MKLKARYHAKETLKDTEHFSSSQTGSVGELLSKLMGEKAPALFNMHGDVHHEFKFKLLSIIQYARHTAFPAYSSLKIRYVKDA